MLERMKMIMWNALGKGFQQRYEYRKLWKDNDYNLLKNNDHKSQKIIFLDTPEHGNLGDHAIVLAMREFIRFYFPDVEIYEFTHGQCKNCLEQIFQITTAEDRIILPGGGFLGTLWMEEEEVFVAFCM